ncbi:unnamed protein product (macronuclear) [Paramecium tetraurelia]|uniref:Uncharacterized protein n=1 Tax=Paramecium tetraurelia TaxID=5888 RepID=A0EDG5_PARTE|nr:uncharacterized protein GSPATT00004201001 [Paramecium tetraurelia]CAK93332.1 unnamed protein product [Paramecium tetraurelia]|eukprot:XP_001460729.1 hypothetical protein (macronuclear) [Paramecium tetraurelia strain d4-2]
MRVYALLCIVAIVYCTQITNQASMFDEQLGQLTKSKLGNTILNMISLQQFTEVDFSPLFTAIDDIVASTQQAKQDEAEQLDSYFQQFLSDSEFYSNQVTEYKTEVAQHQSDITTFQKDRNSLQQSLYDKSQQLTDSQKNQAQLQRTVQNNDQATSKKTAEYDSSISIVDQVIAKLQLVKQSSFIEINKEDLAVSAATFSRRLGEVSHLPHLFEPLSKVLIQMGTSGFADQEQAGNAIKLLNSLREDLVASKQALQMNAQLEKDTNDGLLASLEENINLLNNEIIPQLKGDIETKDGEIATKSGLLKDAQSNLDTAQANLDNVNAGWAARQGQNKQLNDGWDNELMLLSQAESALERGGIRRQ